MIECVSQCMSEYCYSTRSEELLLDKMTIDRCSFDVINSNASMIDIQNKFGLTCKYIPMLWYVVCVN